MMSEIKDAIKDFLDEGVSALPCFSADKHPLYSWKRYQNTMPTEFEIDTLFMNNNYDALCVITGAVSENFETIDFDGGGELYLKWSLSVKEKAPALFNSLIIEATQSSGLHVSYKCEEAIQGNLKSIDIPTQ